MTTLFIDANRDGYEPSQCAQTMTLGALIEELALLEADFGEDVPVYLRHDNGYTFGSIEPCCLSMED